MNEGQTGGTIEQLATPKRSILRAVAGRVLLYTLLCLMVLFALVDWDSLPWRTTPGPASRVQEAPSTGADWPRLLGPSYDAHSTETGLADSWPDTGPPVLWSKKIGAGYSGFSAQAGVVYTQTQSLAEQKLIALDADTGQTIWEHNYGWPYQAGGMFPGPRATPTFADGRIYYAAPNGLVGCVSAAEGKPLWSVNVLQQFQGRGAAFGYACSPVVEEGKVILPVGGPAASVVALDAATGATLWASGTASASYASALPITFQGRRQLVAFLQNTLAGFDLTTGRLLWEQTYDRAHDEHAAAPLYREPHLRIMQAYRAGSHLYELQAGASGNAAAPEVQIKRIRHDAQMSNDIASSVLSGDFVYGFDLREQQSSPGRPSRGSFRCMEFKTGQVRWSSDRPGHAAMIVADGKLMMLNDSGELLLVRVNPDRYEELGRVAIFTGETCWTAPALHGGRVYLRSPTRAACLFVGKPERMTPRQQALATPLAKIAKVAQTDRTWLIGVEREFPFELPEVRELLRWYWFSLAALAGAALLAGAANAVSRFCFGKWSRRTGAIVFYTALLLLGIAATPLANRYASPFVFTWPLALIAIHQIALAAVAWSKRAGHGKSADWVALAGVALLVLAAVFYFKFTRQLSLAPAWYFLLALPAAWPMAVPAARGLCRPGKLSGDILWMLAVFSLYFWAAGGVMMFRSAVSP